MEPEYAGRTTTNELKVGAKAQFCAAPGTPQERVFNVEILSVEAPILLEWQGGEPGVFLGVHRFELHEDVPNQTRFVNTESFNGEMASALMKMSRAILQLEFAAFNEALKKRVETDILHQSKQATSG